MYLNLYSFVNLCHSYPITCSVVLEERISLGRMTLLMMMMMTKRSKKKRNTKEEQTAGEEEKEEEEEEIGDSIPDLSSASLIRQII